mmetsp:Transcript_14006/g.20728  ORF Transcript_14006/g.20728 Transcript_14006/m.20728 type:complete len:116 (+) Transcript_14006:53-400(+)
MGKDTRVTYRRRHSYNTKSNKIKIVKTPGNRYVVHYRKKKAKGPRCGDCKGKINGVKSLRPIEYSRIPKHKRKVTRSYGGTLCAQCVKSRIMRAFLIEEQKIVKKLMSQKFKSKA